MCGRCWPCGRHLLGLINDILDLSKIEAGQFSLVLAEYSLEALVHNIVATAASLAAEKQLEFEVDVEPDLPLRRGDERRLAQALAAGADAYVSKPFSPRALLAKVREHLG